MQIEKLPLSSLKEDPKNAKTHTDEQVREIAESIQRFGNNDPIAIWGTENLVVEGNGRLRALRLLGFQEAECIRLDQLTDEERKAYALVHNKLTMDTGFDDAALQDVLSELKNLDLSGFGFEIKEEKGPALETIETPVLNFGYVLLKVPVADLPNFQEKLGKLKEDLPALESWEYLKS